MARYVYVLGKQVERWVQDGKWKPVDDDNPHDPEYAPDVSSTLGQARLLKSIKELKGQMDWKIMKFVDKPPYEYKGLVE